MSTVIQENKSDNLDVTEELKSVRLIGFILFIIIFVLTITERYLSNTLISFVSFFEACLFLALFRAYIKSLNKFNYGFWGFSFLIFFILFKSFIHFSFIETNSFAFYLSILGLILFAINSYVMSSPIYYPRVQWWEYDYKYRADLKISIEISEQVYKARLTDLRRNAASVEVFEHIPLGELGVLKLAYDEQDYTIPFQIKSSKVIIQGRPYRYGLKVLKKSDDLSKIKKIWSKNKNVKLRNKFKKP